MAWPRRLPSGVPCDPLLPTFPAFGLQGGLHLIRFIRQQEVDREMTVAEALRAALRLDLGRRSSIFIEQNLTGRLSHLDALCGVASPQANCG